MALNTQAHPIVDATAIEWGEHPRVAGIYVKKLLTADENPLRTVCPDYRRKRDAV
jgi:hypothetical protein